MRYFDPEYKLRASYLRLLRLSVAGLGCAIKRNVKDWMGAKHAIGVYPDNQPGARTTSTQMTSWLTG